MKYLLVTEMVFMKINYFYISVAYLFHNGPIPGWLLTEQEIKPSLTLSSHFSNLIPFINFSYMWNSLPFFFEIM